MYILLYKKNTYIYFFFKITRYTWSPTARVVDQSNIGYFHLQLSRWFKFRCSHQTAWGDLILCTWSSLKALYARSWVCPPRLCCTETRMSFKTEGSLRTQIHSIPEEQDGLTSALTWTRSKPPVNREVWAICLLGLKHIPITHGTLRVYATT